jgi:hypothetical protein
MKLFRLVLLLAALFILPGCNSWRNYRLADEFNDSSSGYLALVRWQELDKGGLAFVAKPLREEFRKRVAAAGKVKVVDYRVRNLECRPEKGEAEVTVEWDYYAPPSTRLKTLEDIQKWRYEKVDGISGWVLGTLLPEFK